MLRTAEWAKNNNYILKMVMNQQINDLGATLPQDFLACTISVS